jgi:hypothetical protein
MHQLMVVIGIVMEQEQEGGELHDTLPEGVASLQGGEELVCMCGKRKSLKEQTRMTHANALQLIRVRLRTIMGR